MALQEEASSHVIDANPLFEMEKTSGEVDQLYEVIFRQETYDRKDLFNMIKRINRVDVHKLPRDAQYKFQSLCGRVHTLNVNHMVDAIYEEASALAEGEYDSPEELASRTQTLKEMMADVWSNHSLSQENSNYLRIASLKLGQISSSKIDDMVHPSQANLAEEVEMLPESEVKGAVVDSNWEEAELSIDILQVAQLLYEKDPEGILRFRQLPESVQEELGAVEDSPEYIREMVIYGMGLVRQDGYAPSMKEIEIMFSEAP